MTPESMKAARFYEVNEPLRIEEVPVPEVREDEALVQIKAAGLCGSDVHIVFEGVTPTAFKPITLGHEPAGVVTATGSRVEGWEEGDRVCVVPGFWCGSCRNCVTGYPNVCLQRRIWGIQAEGALAEYLVVPARNLVRLPDSVPFTVGAIITDAVATPFYALSERVALKAGETIAVFGAGGLGLHGVQIARLLGARMIMVVDTREDQLERARTMGADLTINPTETPPVEAILEATGGLGADVAAEFVGLQQTISQCVEAVAPERTPSRPSRRRSSCASRSPCWAPTASRNAASSSSSNWPPPGGWTWRVPSPTPSPWTRSTPRSSTCTRR